MKPSMKHNIVLGSLLTVLAAGPALADGPLNHFGKAAKNVGEATAHSTVGTAKLATGAVAVPFSVVAGIGKVSDRAANRLWEITTAPYDTSVIVPQESDAETYD